MQCQHLHIRHSLPREVCYSAFTALIPPHSTAQVLLQMSLMDQEKGFEAGPASAMPHREEPLPQEWGSTSWEKAQDTNTQHLAHSLQNITLKTTLQQYFRGVLASQVTLQALCVGEKSKLAPAEV